MIHKINDLSDLELVDLLTSAFSKITNPDIIANYHPNFADRPGNIFYILDRGRYNKGAYYIVTSDVTGEYQCSAGWYPYEIDTSIALVLTRMYVSPEVRTKYIIGKTVLPLMIEETKDFDKVWITCNEHNKSIYNWFDRAATNKRPALFDDWPEIYRKFRPIGKKNIYYTEQYVAEYQV